MPAPLAACREVSMSGAHYFKSVPKHLFRYNGHTVKRAFAPAFLSWNSSSEAEYAALAGDAIPESR